ncbi:hypothetical protein ACFVSU_10485 [Microbacterium sp. NPDC058062]|uniref:hypothetical protein n=1 Tax=Microbacterium sp. NPDC058062 TaxID=3346320 RepID=UPI0036DE7160
MTDERDGARPRSRKQQRRLEEFDGQEEAFVRYFKERVYATFTGLAIVLVVSASDHAEPDHAFFALVLGVVGITAAGFVSDIVSHLAVHQEFPSGGEFAVLGRIAGGALGTVVVPGILIALAWLDVMHLETALRVSSIVYIATLGVIGWAAVRRARLSWAQKLVALGILLALGLLVIGLQTLAHSI